MGSILLFFLYYEYQLQIMLNKEQQMQQQQNKKPADLELQKIKPKKDINPDKTIKQLSITSPYKQVSSPMDVDSPARRRKSTFLTQKRMSDVEIAHSELNNYIELLDEKVGKLIDKHQAQFLVAYRNHVKKVRQQMDEIRKKALTNANSSVSQTQKILMLEKQLTIFRDQSLKLFQKVNENQKTIYQLNSRIKQLTSQKQYMQKNVKGMTRRLKHLEGHAYEEQQQEKSAVDLQLNLKNQFRISRPMDNTKFQQNTMKVYDMGHFVDGSIKHRPYTTAVHSKGQSNRSRNNSVLISTHLTHTQNISQINLKIQKTLSNIVNEQIIQKLKQQISQILKNQVNRNIQKGLSQIQRQTTKTSKVQFSKSNISKSFIQSKNLAKRSQLQQYFFKSIQSVKKQITRRKGFKNLNFYSELSSIGINQFKNIDFFRLLELLLSHQKAILCLHSAIFSQSKRYN